MNMTSFDERISSHFDNMKIINEKLMAQFRREIRRVTLHDPVIEK